MSTVSSSARPLRRASRAAAVVLLLLAQLGALAHESAVRHVRCAEHGELVEATAIGSHVEAGVRLVAADLGTTDDDHCALAGTLGHAARTIVPPAVTLADPAVLAAVPLAVPPGTTTAAIYRFAPKTSPPVRTQLG